MADDLRLEITLDEAGAGAGGEGGASPAAAPGPSERALEFARELERQRLAREERLEERKLARLRKEEELSRARGAGAAALTPETKAHYEEIDRQRREAREAEKAGALAGGLDPSRLLPGGHIENAQPFEMHRLARLAGMSPAGYEDYLERKAEERFAEKAEEAPQAAGGEGPPAAAFASSSLKEALEKQAEESLREHAAEGRRRDEEAARRDEERRKRAEEAEQRLEAIKLARLDREAEEQQRLDQALTARMEAQKARDDAETQALADEWKRETDPDLLDMKERRRKQAEARAEREANAKASGRDWAGADRAGEGRKEAGDPYDLSDPLSRKRMEREAGRRGGQRMADHADNMAGRGKAAREASAPFNQAAELAGKAGMGRTASMAGKAGDLAGALAGGGGMGAAGPAGAALAIADEAAKAVAAAFRAAGETAKAAGEFSEKLAKNDVVGAFTGAVDRAAEGLGKIPIVGQMIEAEWKMVTGTIQAFRGVVDAFVSRGRELARYSPDLAAAGGRAELRSTLADIAEANALGERMAKLTDLQSELDVTFRELVTPIKVVILESIIPVMQAIAEYARPTAAGIEIIVTLLKGMREGILSVVSLNPMRAIRNIRNTTGRIAQLVEDAQREKNPPDYEAVNRIIDEMARGGFNSPIEQQAGPLGGDMNFAPRDFP